jgi:hypothetical protein
MTSLEHTLISSVIVFGAYYIGHWWGKKQGVQSAVNFMLDSGMIKEEFIEEIEENE